MNFLSSLLLLLFLTRFLIPTSFTWAKEINQIVAIVDNQIITVLDIEKILPSIQQKLLMSSNSNEQKISYQQIRQLALDQLVEDKLFEIEAKREKVNISEEELERFIKNIRASHNLNEKEFTERLDSYNQLSLTEYHNELKKELIKYKLLENNVKKKIIISNEQIEQAYLDLCSKLVQETNQIRFRHLFLKLANNPNPIEEKLVQQRAESLRNQAVSGTDFAELIKNYSEYPNIKLNDEIGLVMSNSDMIPTMREALVDLKPGDISSVIRIPSGYIIIQLLDNSNFPITLTSDQFKEQIKDKLEKEAIDKRYQEWINELRLKTYIKIMD